MGETCNWCQNEAQYEFGDTEGEFKRVKLCGEHVMETLIGDGVPIPVSKSDAQAIAMWRGGDEEDGELKTEKLMGYKVEAGKSSIAILDGRGSCIELGESDTLVVVQTEDGR